MVLCTNYTKPTNRSILLDSTSLFRLFHHFLLAWRYGGTSSTFDFVGGNESVTEAELLCPLLLLVLMCIYRMALEGNPKGGLGR